MKHLIFDIFYVFSKELEKCAKINEKKIIRQRIDFRYTLLLHSFHVHCVGTVSRFLSQECFTNKRASGNIFALQISRHVIEKLHVMCVGLTANHYDLCELIDTFFRDFSDFKYFAQFVFCCLFFSMRLTKKSSRQSYHLLGVANEHSIPKRLRFEITILTFYILNLQQRMTHLHFSHLNLCKTTVYKQMNSFMNWHKEKASTSQQTKAKTMQKDEEWSVKRNTLRWNKAITVNYFCKKRMKIKK